MPIRHSCECGAELLLREEQRAQGLACPRCRKQIVAAPAEASVQASPGVPGRAQRSGGGAAPEQQLEVSERDLDISRPVRKPKIDRRGLGRVSQALTFHYVLPFLFLSAAGSGLLALIFTLGVRVFELGQLVEAAHGLFFFSGVLFLITGIGAIPGIALGLIGTPPKAGRGLLLLSLGLLCAGLLPATLLLILQDHRWVFFVVALITFLGSWSMWIGSLVRLGKILRRPELAEECRRTLVHGIRVAVVCTITLMVGGLAMMLIVRYPIAFWAVGPMFFGALATIAFSLGGFDSFLGFFFAPTAIPFARIHQFHRRLKDGASPPLQLISQSPVKAPFRTGARGRIRTWFQVTRVRGLG
jgi:hypothetical protein